MHTLEEAQNYIEQNRIDKRKRPAFHVTAPVGWINDPNGFSTYQNKVHLFYQYHPYSTNWGPMHWGHVVSSDMIKWEERPVALAPDQAYDHAGVFSGSALETPEGHVLIYTSVEEKEDDTGNKTAYQTQSLAIGDGENYHKVPENPVILGNQLPEGFNQSDFRDPKVWFEDGKYWLVAGNLSKEKHGQIVLFSSDDLRHWQYENVLAGDEDGVIGKMWECPDFFKLDGKHVLITSPQNMSATAYEFHNGHNAVYFVGDYDEETHTFDKGCPHALDYGLDFYAPQTTQLPDGRRILVAWMKSWDSLAIPDGQEWQGMMTLPRELSLENGQLVQRPIHELSDYHTNTLEFSGVISKSFEMIKGVSGRQIDMTLRLSGTAYISFTIDLAVGVNHYTRFTYNRSLNTIGVDRTYSGLQADLNCQRKMTVSSADSIELRFILDSYSIELFVNDGEKVMSTEIQTPLDSQKIRFFSDGETKLSLVKHDIIIP